MWQPVAHERNLTDRIIGRVEQLINDESLEAGDKLPSERDMAQMLGVSRPSLREAVRILQARGRLLVRHGQGVFVQPHPSENDLHTALSTVDTSIDELFAVREVLEVPAAGWAAERVSRDGLRRLRVVLDEMGEVLDRSDAADVHALRRLDIEFHMRIAAAAGNRYLRQTSHVLLGLLHSSMDTTLTIPGRPQASQRDHERMYAALAAHDRAAARRAARSHIRAVHQAAARRFEREGEYATRSSAPAVTA